LNPLLTMSKSFVYFYTYNCGCTTRNERKLYLLVITMHTGGLPISILFISGRTPSNNSLIYDYGHMYFLPNRRVLSTHLIHQHTQRSSRIRHAVSRSKTMNVLAGWSGSRRKKPSLSQTRYRSGQKKNTV